MINLELSPCVTPEIEVNGHRFPVLLGEVGIYETLTEIKNKAIDGDSDPTPEKIIAFCRSVNDAIDSIIGTGAMAKLADGRSVNAATAMKWLGAISSEALAANLEAIKNN